MWLKKSMVNLFWDFLQLFLRSRRTTSLSPLKLNKRFIILIIIGFILPISELPVSYWNFDIPYRPPKRLLGTRGMNRIGMSAANIRSPSGRIVDVAGEAKRDLQGFRRWLERCSTPAGWWGEIFQGPFLRVRMAGWKARWWGLWKLKRSRNSGMLAASDRSLHGTSSDVDPSRE